MTTQATTVVKQERPAKVEPGMQFSNPVCSPEYNPHTVVGPAPQPDCTDGVELRTGNGQRRVWSASYIREHWTYLGPTEPRGGDAATPAPAVGQRWRDAMPGYDRTWVIIGPHDTRGWRVRDPQNSYETWWEKADFADGSLVFVDHGEPASPPSQPRTGPHAIAMDNCTVAPASNHATIVFTPPPAPSARAILQAKECARQAKREEDARAVAAFVDFFDCLPDAP